MIQTYIYIYLTLNSYSRQLLALSEKENVYKFISKTQAISEDADALTDEIWERSKGAYEEHEDSFILAFVNFWLSAHQLSIEYDGLRLIDERQDIFDFWEEFPELWDQYNDC